ncbi:MAG: hypothetical protein LBI42_12965 [Chitinispirillales bacterium]|nr:hypothetical protein [Chitinispirillales bacterium]
MAIEETDESEETAAPEQQTERKSEKDSGAEKEKEKQLSNRKLTPAERTASMVKWTKRTAALLGLSAFGVTFLVNFEFEIFEAAPILSAGLKGTAAGVIFWFTGLIVGNIFLKSLVSDVPADPSNLVEGGILQRVYLYQKRLDPYLNGNANVIQVEAKIENKKDIKKKDGVENNPQPGAKKPL